MARIPITVMGYRCERCEHEWLPNNYNQKPTDYDQEPAVCPKCNSSYWNHPKKSMLTYEEFRDKIAETLRSEGGPLTWTEIRTRAKLPQKFPNNQWVRNLEKDIQLSRRRDMGGIIHWQLRERNMHNMFDASNEPV